MSKDIDVKRIASLARIQLREEEIEKLGHELEGILAFVEKLSELNTENVTPLTGGTNLENVMRLDEPKEEVPNRDDSALLVKASPGEKGGYVKVKAVFDRS